MKKILVNPGIIVWVLTVIAFPLAAQESQTERYSALAHVPKDVGPRLAAAGSTIDVEILIRKYSTDGEVQALGQMLLSSGPEAVVMALRKKKSIGKVSLTGSARIGQYRGQGFFDLKLIRSMPVEGGREVTAVTDRPIGFLESYNPAKSKDYPFGVLQMQFKGNDKGEGTLIYAAKVRVIDKTKLEIENYGSSGSVPVELTDIRRR